MAISTGFTVLRIAVNIVDYCTIKKQLQLTLLTIVLLRIAVNIVDYCTIKNCS